MRSSCDGGHEAARIRGNDLRFDDLAGFGEFFRELPELLLAGFGERKFDEAFLAVERDDLRLERIAGLEVAEASRAFAISAPNTMPVPKRPISK